MVLCLKARESRSLPGLKNTAAIDAGWSSPVARQAHNLKVAGSNPAPATKNPDISIIYIPQDFHLAGFSVFGSMSCGNTSSGFLVEVRVEDRQRIKAFDRCYGSKNHRICMQ